jgi:Rab GDP dissociation inhibitor
MVSGIHCVCKNGFAIAIVSATVETENPEKELEPAYALLGNVREKFITVSFF